MLSFVSLSLLCLTRDIRWDIFVGLVFVLIVVLGKANRFCEIAEKKVCSTYIVSFLLSATGFINLFGQLNEESGLPRRICSKYVDSPEIVFGLLCLSLFLLSLYSSNIVISMVIRVLRPIIDIIKKNTKPLLILFGIHLIAIISIIRADFFYVDDLGRAIYGYQLTGSFGRYIASFLSTFIHANNWLPDISPLSQIIAVLIVSVSGVLLISLFNSKRIIKFWSLLAVLPIGLSPYFLTCISYKYDAPYMAISILFSIIPLHYFTERRIKYISLTSICSFLMCSTYQASSGIFPMLVFIISLNMWLKREKIKKTIYLIVDSVIGYMIGLLIFRVLFISETVNSDLYIDNSLAPEKFIINISNYFNAIINDFGVVWISFVLIIVFSFIVFSIKKTKQHIALAIPVVVVSIIVLFLLSNGVYSFLSNPSTTPRVLYGFGVFFAILAIPLTMDHNHFLGKSAIIIVAWLMIVFSFTYGNALQMQKEYTEFRTEQIFTDLKDINVINTSKKVNVQISGTIGFAKSVDNLREKMPLIGRMVPVLLQGDNYYWGHYRVLHYYGADNFNYFAFNDENGELDLTKLDLPVVVDNSYHRIKANDENVLIELKNSFDVETLGDVEDKVYTRDIFRRD